ncbi:MAG TPA: UvrD-helicase domain-containing protein [Candidatus Nitrosotalea sp.]|nr:UvrD-helicase domain-containing protein [Candidatus Nitrosotalea sp.]
MPASELQRAELERLVQGLNPAQREAVEHLRGPLLIFAGAGSGKTRVLTTRIANLLAQGEVEPYQLLAVTFTNKAAREMRERVARLVSGVDGMWVGTFHSTAARMLRRDAERIGLTASFVIFDADDQRAALRRVLDDLRLDPKRHPPALFANLISQAKNELLSYDTIPLRGPQDELLGSVFRLYEELLARSNALDFDDLIVKTVGLLRSEADVLGAWRARFQQVLVDEYQDTNRAQYMLVSLLAAEHRNLAVVGDDDQAIYGWRGADVRNILDFKKDYPDATVIRLEQNYRSTQAILDAAHAVIRHNSERADKRLWTDRQGGELIAVAQLYNEVEEAEYVADEIARLIRSENRRPGDCAVLYRTNAQSRAFEDVFGRRRIPYRLVGGVRFWERREVKDCLSYLRFIFNPADAVGFARIVNVPRRKIGPVSVEAVVAQARAEGVDLLSLLGRPEGVPGLPRAAQAPLAVLGADLRALRLEMAGQTPARLLELTVERIGLDRAYEEAGPQREARLENLRELRGLAEEYDEYGPGEEALGRFLSEVSLRSDVDALDEDEQGVTLITLHMVKGLEFPIVFLVGVEDGLVPHRRAIEDPTQMPEERRVCYVGMTRARDRLYLTCAFRRHLYGQSQAAFPSRFLKELPASLIAPQNRGAAAVSPPRAGFSDRLREQPIAPAAPAPTSSRYASGDRVSHPSFGSGTVVKSTLTRSDEELVVRFEGAGVKILSATLAPLSRL